MFYVHVYLIRIVFCLSDDIHVTHHDSDSIVYQGGRSIQTGGVFTHIQSGPGKGKRKTNVFTYVYKHRTPSACHAKQKCDKENTCGVYITLQIQNGEELSEFPITYINGRNFQSLVHMFR